MHPQQYAKVKKSLILLELLLISKHIDKNYDTMTNEETNQICDLVKKIMKKIT
jgi:hypothetical protein